MKNPLHTYLRRCKEEWHLDIKPHYSNDVGPLLRVYVCMQDPNYTGYLLGYFDKNGFCQNHHAMDEYTKEFCTYDKVAFKRFIENLGTALQKEF